MKIGSGWLFPHLVCHAKQLILLLVCSDAFYWRCTWNSSRTPRWCQMHASANATGGNLEGNNRLAFVCGRTHRFLLAVALVCKARDSLLKSNWIYLCEKIMNQLSQPIMLLLLSLLLSYYLCHNYQSHCHYYHIIIIIVIVIIYHYYCLLLHLLLSLLSWFKVLNQEEVSRRDHRRARNRVAATKCRNKRRKAAEDVQKVL